MPSHQTNVRLSKEAKIAWDRMRIETGGFNLSLAVNKWLIEEEAKRYGKPTTSK